MVDHCVEQYCIEGTDLLANGCFVDEDCCVSVRCCAAVDGCIGSDVLC